MSVKASHSKVVEENIVAENLHKKTSTYIYGLAEQRKGRTQKEEEKLISILLPCNNKSDAEP
jgi:hypothetical protein